MQTAGTLRPFAEGSITISTTAKQLSVDFVDFGFTAEDIEKADVVHIYVYDNNIRYRYFDNLATADTGYRIYGNSEFTLNGKPIIEKFSVIRESADAELWITLLTYGL